MEYLSMILDFLRSLGGVDIYILAVGEYIRANPLFFGLLFIILKKKAEMTPGVTDDKILTMLAKWFRLK